MSIPLALFVKNEKEITYTKLLYIYNLPSKNNMRNMHNN
jgi:hypothetical protein